MYSISYTAVSWRLDSKNSCTSNTSLCRLDTIFLVITLYSIQSAKLFLQSSELGFPHPFPHTQPSVPHTARIRPPPSSMCSEDR